MGCVAHPSRRGQEAAPQDEENQKAGSRPAVLLLTGRWVPGRSEAPPGRRSLLGLLGLLCLLRLFSLLRFLSHSILIWVLMDGNATRGMLGGGPTSQHPRNQSQQIRRPLPRAVTSLSLRYPQLLCVLVRFRTKFSASTASMRRASHRFARPAGLTSRQDRLCLRFVPKQKQAYSLLLHRFKTTLWIADAGRGSVKRGGCMLSARPRGWSGRVIEIRGERGLRVQGQ
jgi:hypothetical protein